MPLAISRAWVSGAKWPVSRKRIAAGAALAQFVCEEDFTHVKACDGQNCTLMFADHTRRTASMTADVDARNSVSARWRSPHALI